MCWLITIRKLGEYIYVPDMLVAIVALSNYAKQHNGKYLPVVLGWLQETSEAK